jgi:acyl-CoA thioesterase-1
LICFVPVLAAPSPAVVVLGDSLSSAHGIAAESGWVDLLAERLSREGYAYRVVNASITGDTTRGGLARLPALLAREQPDIVIIELGGNDGLRGIDTQVTAANLEDMIRLSREAGARVLLLGVKLPANYGPAFGMAFHQVYLDAAETNRVALVPFFLDGVALDPSMMQADGIHPNARAQPILLNNVWAALEPLLQAEGKTSGEPISSIRILLSDARR